MTYVALVLLVAFMVQHVLGWHVIRWLLRGHARERDLLLNQIMHLAGKTWTPPPAQTWEPPAEPNGLLPVAPEQMPDDYDWASD